MLLLWLLDGDKQYGRRRGRIGQEWETNNWVSNSGMLLLNGQRYTSIGDIPPAFHSLEKDYKTCSVRVIRAQRVGTLSIVDKATNLVTNCSCLSRV